MESIFIISGIIAFLFSIIKVIESKAIDKKYPPIKYIIRDCVVIFLSAYFGLFIYIQLNGPANDLLNIITDNKSMNLSTTQVFTDHPEF